MADKKIPMDKNIIDAIARNAAKKVIECCSKVEEQRQKYDRLIKKAERAQRWMAVFFSALNPEDDRGPSAELLKFFSAQFFEIQKITPNAQKIRELEKILRALKK